MDFTTIGKIGTYARMNTLKFAANYRLKTGQSLVSSTGTISFKQVDHSSIVDKMLKSKSNMGAEEITKKRLATIKRKLMSGKRLSNEEMGFLLKNDSKLYRKAQAAEDARQELKEALSKAKTKQEARKALLDAKMKASAACSAELDAASKAGGGGGSVAAGGYTAGSEVGGAVFSAPTAAASGPIDGGTMSEASASAGGEPALIAVNSDISNADGNPTNNNQSVAFNQTNAQSNQSNQSTQSNNQSNQSNQINQAAQSNGTSNEKDTRDDIIEKYLMIIRALEDEWKTFTKSKQYRSLPEDYDDESKSGKVIERDYDRESERQRRTSGAAEYKMLEVTSAYRAAMSLTMIE